MKQLIIFMICLLSINIIYANINVTNYEKYEFYFDEISYWNFTVPEESISGIYNFKHTKKTCLEMTLNNTIFDIQISKAIKKIPIDKIMKWKNLTYNDFNIMQFKYKPCEKNEI